MNEVLFAVGGALLLMGSLTFFGRLLFPWMIGRSVNRDLEKMVAEVKAGRLPQGPDRSEARLHLSWDLSGFTITDTQSPAHKSVQMSWVDITSVTAFKRDLYTVDCICLFLERSEGGGLELNEEMNGWLDFCTALPLHLPRANPFEKWLWPVASPAFATNPTEIFRPQTPGGSGAGSRKMKEVSWQASNRSGRHPLTSDL